MKKDKRLIFVILLLIGIGTLSIGLATFSNILTIRSSTTVSPDESSFKVFISGNAKDINYLFVNYGSSYPDANHKPSGNSGHIIRNSTNQSSISDINVTFTGPNQTATWTVYIHNQNNYDVYYSYNQNEPNLKCIAGEGTTDELVQKACSCISNQLKRKESTTYTKLEPTSKYKVSKNSVEEIKLEIKYNRCDYLADGPFDIEIGDYEIITTSAP